MLQLGIDFGTWYTSAVLYRGEGQQFVTVKDPSFHGASIPSCLYYNSDQEWRFGGAAWNSRNQDRERFRHSELKNTLLMHGGSEPLQFGEQFFKLEELIGLLLGWIKQEADRMADSWSEKPLEHVTLTVPVDYSEARKEIMQKAAILAGFKHIELLDEPVAAALSVLKQGKIQTAETVLIYDLGGGTFDAALVRQTGKKFDVLAKDGLPQCGGVHFDHAIYRWLSEQVSKNQPDLFTMMNPRNKDISARRLRVASHDHCRDAKHQLSSSNHWDIVVPAGDYPNYRLNRSALEGLLSEYLAQTIAVCKRVLEKANLKLTELDHIVMVGGSSRIPAVAGLLKQTFGKDPVLAADPELAIAEGAALRQTVLGQAKPAKARTQASSKQPHTKNFSALGKSNLSSQTWPSLINSSTTSSPNSKPSRLRLPAVQSIHGWPSDKVQALQKKSGRCFG